MRPQWYDFAKFSLQNMTHCGDDLQQFGLKARNIEELANLMVHYFFDHFIVKKTGEKSCALVRFFMTYPCASLDEELRRLTDKILNGQPVPQDAKCMVLLATAGLHPEWNSTRLSKGHRVIPLLNEDMVKQTPMLRELIYQLGIDASSVLNPDPAIAFELEKEIIKVYYIPDASESPYIPQNDFAIPFGIKSVLGFGGILPTGNLFAMLIFSRVKIPRNTADMFKNIDLNVRMTVMPFVTEKIFVIDKNEITECERLKYLMATQVNILEMYKQTAVDQSRRLENVSFKVMKFLRKLARESWLYISLLLASGIFLFLYRQTRIEFALHLAAIPLEILLGVFVIGKLLERRDRAEKLRRSKLRKSYLFRSKMRNLFCTNLNALRSPVITMSKIKDSSLAELQQMRSAAEHLEYASPEAMEAVIMEYVSAYHLFQEFMEKAFTQDIESNFENMLYILHFIEDVKLFKQTHPDKLFIYEAQNQRLLMKKVKKIMGDGILKFLDYVIELKEKDPDMFYDLLTDYELWCLEESKKG
jgi:hypothetical protein